MKSASNPKEHTVKTTLTSSYIRLTVAVAVATPLAVICGTGKWG